MRYICIQQHRQGQLLRCVTLGALPCRLLALDGDYTACWSCAKLYIGSAFIIVCCRLSAMAGPLFCQALFNWSLQTIATAFVGHLNNPLHLSSAALASSLFNVSGLSIIVGLAAGMETLCGQVSTHNSHTQPLQWCMLASHTLQR